MLTAAVCSTKFPWVGEKVESESEGLRENIHLRLAED
jgi:hypothetical protein